MAKHVGDLVRGFAPTDMAGVGKVRAALDRYASLLNPWAEAVGERMVREVAARDERAWMRVANQMSRALKEEIATAPTGHVMRKRMAEQVKLITSLPTEAGQRVHDLTLRGMIEGARTDAIAAEILRTGEVTKSRADLIARTEVSRTATALTQARAEHVGSEGYTWRTVGDGSVRASHRAMAGKFVRWDSPPTLDDLTGHAGALPNCRCFCEPVISD